MNKRLHPSKRWPRNYLELQRPNSCSEIVTKIHNALIPNLIRPEVEKNLSRNRSTTSLILTICWKRTCKKSRSNIILRRFLQGVWFHTQGKDGTNTSNIETVTAIMKLYKNMKGTVCSPDGYTDFFGIVAFAKRYIRILLVYNLPTWHTTNVNKSYKRKWFHFKKDKK